MGKAKCKNPKLKSFLLDNGLEYIWVDTDKEGLTYWVFEKSERYYELKNLYYSQKQSKLN